MVLKKKSTSKGLDRRKFLIGAGGSLASAAAPAIAKTKPVYDVVVGALARGRR